MDVKTHVGRSLTCCNEESIKIRLAERSWRL